MFSIIFVAIFYIAMISFAVYLTFWRWLNMLVFSVIFVSVCFTVMVGFAVALAFDAFQDD